MVSNMGHGPIKYKDFGFCFLEVKSFQDNHLLLHFFKIAHGLHARVLSLLCSFKFLMM